MRIEVQPARNADDPDRGIDQASILDELMTAAQVARILQLRQSTVEDYARREVLPSIKLGHHRRFTRSEVEEAIAHLAACS